MRSVEGKDAGKALDETVRPLYAKEKTTEAQIEADCSFLQQSAFPGAIKELDVVELVLDSSGCEKENGGSGVAASESKMEVLHQGVSRGVQKSAALVNCLKRLYWLLSGT